MASVAGRVAVFRLVQPEKTPDPSVVKALVVDASATDVSAAHFEKALLLMVVSLVRFVQLTVVRLLQL